MNQLYDTQSMPGQSEDISISYRGYVGNTLMEGLNSYDDVEYPPENVYFGSRLGQTRRIWNEAHLENDWRDALAEDSERTPLTDELPPSTTDSRTAQAHALAVMRAREERTLSRVAQLEVALEHANDRVAEALRQRDMTEAQANRPVTEGDDPRMTEFWEKAANAADEAGFCPEYDRIAELLGGTPRSVEYRVMVQRTVVQRTWVTISVPTTQSTINDIYDAAEQYINDGADPEWNDCRVDSVEGIDYDLS